jgi:DNA processing protein
LPRGRPSSLDQAIVTERLLPPDARFPRALLDLQGNAPSQLWVRGRIGAIESPVMVAMVGTRRATPYGLRVAREMAGALARAGACVVSGMALGIDAASHRAALEAGGETIAVLGTGLDVTYPPAHRALQREIAAQGALVSELEPLWSGKKYTFPQRNRIIAALSAATIVVEAPARSGALNTAEHALQLGRHVAAVPGPIDQPSSDGSNRLIRDGALLLASVEEALSLVGLTPVARTPRVNPDGDESRIWSALEGGPLDMDSLAARSGIPAVRCMRAVTTLELAGAIECALTGEIRRR